MFKVFFIVLLDISQVLIVDIFSYEWVCGANDHIELFRQTSKLGKVINLSYPRGGNQVRF